MTESKGVRAADDLMRRLVKVPASDVGKAKPGKRRKPKRKK